MQDATQKRPEISLPRSSVALPLADELSAHWRYFALFTLAAFALRLFFVLKFPYVTPDGFLYGDIAKNWIQSGMYGLSSPYGPEPTYIRLPGYPGILAILFRLAGVDHYGAVRFLQVFVDVGTCFVVADLALRVNRISSSRVARAAFALTALCPFLANYTALALTETFAVFFAALALDLAVAAFDERRYGLWAWCGGAIAASILLRPDGGMLLIIIGGALIAQLLRGGAEWRRRTVIAGLVLGAVSLGPLIPWTIRNWRTFHIFEPLVPASASSPTEHVPWGFYRWVNTWLIDYASMEDVSFRPDGEALDIGLVPSRAFDDAQQRQRVADLFAAYNEKLVMAPALDDQFAHLATERIRRHPLEFYLLLPLARGMDLWLRPRTEMLPLNPHWWWFDDMHDDLWGVAFGSVGLLYVGAALAGLVRFRSSLRYLPLLLGFVIFRTVFLAFMGSPEPRYVLECFPVMLVLSATAFTRHTNAPRSA